jgi:oxygen-independent coproporphyrinogen III oxidase
MTVQRASPTLSAMSAPRIDAELIRRYECRGPRYTSYPSAVQFHTGFDANAYRNAASASNLARPARDLSLYVHIPFCASPCFYCGCNKIVTRSMDRADAYLARLYREIELQSELFDAGRVVQQLHFGGGTPTFLDPPRLQALLSQLSQHFELTSKPEHEYSIEIDPRTVDARYVDALAELGFHRMSLGVQDFDPAVQRAINRVQPADETLAVIEHARTAGFGSISVDLIYGLPLQTVAGFERTLQQVIAARPDRLAVYAYAHLPQVFKPQRRLKAEDLPTPEVRLELLRLTIERLTAAGYEYVGMDHFALPTDELVSAKRQRTLHRNFQGYSTRAQCELVGLGVSSIGKVGNAFAQNYKTLPDYYAAVDAGRLPVQRGIAMHRDDIVRAAVIQELMCHERIGFASLSRQLHIDFERYFADELQRLKPLEADSLIARTADEIIVTDTGRLLIRNVAMVFDAYLRDETRQQPMAAAAAFSRTI